MITCIRACHTIVCIMCGYACWSAGQNFQFLALQRFFSILCSFSLVSIFFSIVNQYKFDYIAVRILPKQSNRWNPAQIKEDTKKTTNKALLFSAYPLNGVYNVDKVQYKPIAMNNKNNIQFQKEKKKLESCAHFHFVYHLVFVIKTLMTVYGTF